MDGIYVEFPNYNVAIDGKEKVKVPLGHALAIAVDEKTGITRGSEYGRYSGIRSKKYGNA